MPVEAPKDETAEMLRLRRAGLPYRQIAARYGLSVTAVHSRLGLKPTQRARYPRPGIFWPPGLPASGQNLTFGTRT